MATVRIIENILDNKVNTFSIEKGCTIESVIREYTSGTSYADTFVECYDCETGKTFYAPIEDNETTANAIVQVNQKDISLDYIVKEDDIVAIVITPANDNFDIAGALSGAFSGMGIGMSFGFMLGGPVGAVVGGIIGFAVGFIAGGFITAALMSDDDSSSTSGIDTDQLPDVRGSQNQPLTDQPLPMVLGKHLATPFIVGSPWNEISGEHGETNYIHILYAVGYAPLRLTDFKLGDQYLAHNQSWSANADLKNIWHGTLHGTDDDAGYNTETGEWEDKGDIVNNWSNNDISLEILQQGQNGESIEYGGIYPYAKIQEDVKANVLFIADGDIEDIDADKQITYKGLGLQNGLRTNRIQFTEQFPKSARVELDFSSGLFKTRSETDDDESETKYYRIPLWTAIQWRVQSDDNVTTNGGDAGVFNDLNWTDDVYENGVLTTPGHFTSTQRSWHSFTSANENLGTGVYTAANRITDLLAHSGNTFPGLHEGIGEAEEYFMCDYDYVYEGAAWYAFDHWEFVSGDSFNVDPNNKSAYAIEVTRATSCGESGYYITVGYNGMERRYYCEWEYINENLVNGAWYAFDHWTYYEGDEITIDPNNKGNYNVEVRSYSSCGESGFIIDVTFNDESAYTGTINDGWLNADVFNFQSLGGTNSEQDGINEFRVVTEVDFVQWARNNLSYSSEEDFVKKFKAYFYDDSNSTKSIEVRVVRVSPCYLDETVSTKKHSAFKFSDIFTWATLTSEILDGDELKNNNAIVQKRPLNERLMRKLCVVSLKAKTDNVDQLSTTLKKFTCIAQSFSPYYDKAQRKWFPLNVETTEKYYKPYDDDYNPGAEITKTQFEQDRQNGIKSTRTPAGNDFVKNLVNNVIRIDANKDSSGRYYIPDGDILKYCGNNVASMFLLAGIGAHLGIDALGYKQTFYKDGQLTNSFGDFNMAELAKWYKWAECVKDGSTYGTAGYYYDHDGNRVWREANEEVEVYFAANAYIYQKATLESILSKIAIAGRAVYCRDQKNRLSVVIDKEEDYPVALINQQNTLKSSYTLSFSDLPSGLQITYPDENDGYVTNTLYCMNDGEDEKNPKNAIEQYKFDFVTNNVQQWSLGRYMLANRIMNREVVTKQLGAEGASIGLGNIVVLQDDLMLIGTDTGGRITKLIENNNSIYGFIINNTYKFTGETTVEEVGGVSVTRSVQGVTIMQPAQYRESRVITVRLGLDGQKVIDGDGVIYTLEKGNTNVVIFENPISKNDDSSNGSTIFVYKPQLDNIVGFGLVSQESAWYRVVKIKPDAKRTYEFTLLKYQENLYKYGEKLPSFQNNMTIPDRSGEDSFALSNNVTQTDLVKALTESADIAQGKIDDTFGFTPPTPSNLTANVKEDCIQLTCSVNVDNVNNIDHITYEITKYRIRNGELETLVQTIDGSYSTEYYYDRSWEGYPEKKASSVVENDGSLDFWTFRARAVSIYLDEDGNRYQSEWTSRVNPSSSSLSAYGTWIPPKPSSLSFVAEEEGINASWLCDTSNVYGSIQYTANVYYESALMGSISSISKSATYQFNRSVDGYPEKSGTQGMKVGTNIIGKYYVIITAENIVSGSSTNSNVCECDTSKYKTWIPSVPTISSRVSNRNITLYLSQDKQCYGTVNYLVGVRRYDDAADTFYVPDLETNPYSRESAYKKIINGLFVVGHIESESQYSQTVPLETQNGTSGILDVDESSDQKILAVPHPGSTDSKLLVLGLGGYAPIDTSYQFEAYAYNKTVEDYYDSQSEVGHAYNKDTYHKVSSSSGKKNVTALATSVQDVLNGSIISSKVGEGAITETKIEDDAISTPKLQANAVIGTKMFSYNNISLASGTHVISGFAAGTDDEFDEYINTVKNNRSDTTSIDNYIKEHSNNYWMGLDTEHPEFYMGDRVVGRKNEEDANYFHYYYESGETNLDIKLSNFIVTAISSTIKGFFNVRNKNGSVKYTGANAFLQVNPEFVNGGTVEVECIAGYFYNAEFYEDSAHTVLIEPSTADTYKDITDTSSIRYYRWNGSAYIQTAGTVDGESVIVKGDVTIDNKNSDDSAGTLTVRGLSSLLGGAQIGAPASGETALTQDTKIYGTVGISGATVIKDTLLVSTDSATYNNTLFQIGDSTKTNTFSTIYGRLIAMNGITSYSSIGATALSASGQIVAQDGVISNITQMTLDFGLPSEQGTLSTKMYADAFALKGRANDAAWLRFMEVSNDGFLEIATGDDGTEPIYVRQYNTSTQVVHQATLLDANGNTTFPGTVSGAFVIPIRSSSYTSSTNGEIWIE